LFLKPNSFISNLATTILQHGENNPWNMDEWRNTNNRDV
jgi:hypothetical protein